MRKDKTRGTKIPQKRYRFTAEEIADIAGCTTGYVKKIRAGVVRTRSAKARRVLSADDLLREGGDELLKGAKEILNPRQTAA